MDRWKFAETYPFHATIALCSGLALNSIMSFAPKNIVGAQKLMGRYGGRWPTFHDAEIIELRLHRGGLIESPENPDLVGPELVVKIQTRIEAPGTLPTLATLRFDWVENLEILGFNHQNALERLLITPRNQGFAVKLNAAFGMNASFDCGSIEVLEALD